MIKNYDVNIIRNRLKIISEKNIQTLTVIVEGFQLKV